MTLRSLLRAIFGCRRSKRQSRQTADSPARGCTRTQSLRLEPLENRRLLTADLYFTEGADPGYIHPGDEITYTLSLSNEDSGLGSEAAANVTVADALPTGTTLLSAQAPTGWTATLPTVGTNGTVRFHIASLPISQPWQSALFTIVVDTDAGSFQDGAKITNTATVDTDTASSIGEKHYEATVETAVFTTDGDASGAGILGPATIARGAQFLYTVNVKNVTGMARNVTVIDELPAGTTFVSASAPAGSGFSVQSAPNPGEPGTVTFAADRLADSVSLTVAVRVDPAFDVSGPFPVLLNAVTANCENDADTQNNNDFYMSYVVAEGQAVLGVVKDGPATVQAGNNLVYTLDVFNLGPSTARSITLTDVVPDHTTFVSAVAPAGWNVQAPPPGGTGSVIITGDKLMVEEAFSFELTVKSDANFPGPLICNEAEVAGAYERYDASGQEILPREASQGNTSNTVETTVQVQADLGVSVVPTAVQINPGKQVTITITAQNYGPSVAANVSLTDTLPASYVPVATLTQLSGPTFSVSGASATGDTLGVGQSAVFQLVLAVDPATPDQTRDPTHQPGSRCQQHHAGASRRDAAQRRHDACRRGRRT